MCACIVEVEMPAKLSKHRHIARVLKSRIARGVYTERLPGEKRLAVELGVNYKTIQSALTYLEGQGFVERIPGRGTFLSPNRKEGGSRERFFVHFFMPGEKIGAQSWTIPVLAGFERAGALHGAETIVHGEGKTDGKDELVRRVLAATSEQKVLGTCLLSTTFNLKDTLGLVNAASPVVLADCDMEDPVIPLVVFDDVGAGRLAAQRLTGLGHRRLLWVDYPTSETAQLNRLIGFKQVLRHIAGTEPIRQITSRPHGEFHRHLHAILRERLRPTAVMCVEPELAEVVIHLAAATGLSVPQDLSVMAMGSAGGTLYRPKLSGVIVDCEQMGTEALELLLDEEALANPRKVFVGCRVVQGTTTGPAPAE